MSADYKEIHEQAEQLLRRAEAMCDDHQDEMAEALTDAARDVREVIESGRPPRSVEDKIKRVQQYLQRLKAAPTPAISPQDAGTLLNNYEQLRRQVRELPNY